MCVCVCARLYAAAASHQSSLIVARLFSTLSSQKSSPSSALPLLFLRCARDDEIDGRSVCIPPAESIIVARSSRSSQCLLFCFSFLVCVQFFAQNTHTHTDVILLFLFFLYLQFFFLFWSLAIIVCRLDDLGSSLRCYGPQIDQQARFCSFKKKKNFYFVGKTQFLDVVT